jgi:hypothetical protein
MTDTATIDRMQGDSDSDAGRIPTSSTVDVAGAGTAAPRHL